MGGCKKVAEFLTYELCDFALSFSYSSSSVRADEVWFLTSKIISPTTIQVHDTTRQQKELYVSFI